MLALPILFSLGGGQSSRPALDQHRKLLRSLMAARAATDLSRSQPAVIPVSDKPKEVAVVANS
jgi:hypothetical protein